MIKNINQAIAKLTALGADQSEIWHYGMPSWWTPEMDTNWRAIRQATDMLSDRYQIPAGRLLFHQKPVQLSKPLNQALLEYTARLLTISNIKEGELYFHPTKKYEVIGVSTINSTINTGAIKWYLYTVDDLVFLERVLNVNTTLK